MWMYQAINAVFEVFMTPDSIPSLISKIQFFKNDQLLVTFHPSDEFAKSYLTFSVPEISKTCEDLGNKLNSKPVIVDILKKFVVP
jgi:hypothetical protein